MCVLGCQPDGDHRNPQPEDILLRAEQWFTAFWFAIAVAGGIYLRILRRHSSHALHESESSLIMADRTPNALLIGGGTILLLVGATAVISPPNVWDAHGISPLPRVTMWMSNHSVDFFPTPDYAQLVFGTWAEYAMMHLDLLWGSDRLVNLVQEFVSFLGTITGTSRLLPKCCWERTGVGRYLPPLVCATHYPEAVLEASGANEHSSGFLLDRRDSGFPAVFQRRNQLAEYGFAPDFLRARVRFLPKVAHMYTCHHWCCPAG